MLDVREGPCTLAAKALTAEYKVCFIQYIMYQCSQLQCRVQSVPRVPGFISPPYTGDLCRMAVTGNIPYCVCTLTRGGGTGKYQHGVEGVTDGAA